MRGWRPSRPAPDDRIRRSTASAWCLDAPRSRWPQPRSIAARCSWTCAATGQRAIEDGSWPFHRSAAPGRALRRSASCHASSCSTRWSAASHRQRRGAGGLRAGDRLLAIGGQSLRSWDQSPAGAAPGPKRALLVLTNVTASATKPASSRNWTPAASSRAAAGVSARP